MFRFTLLCVIVVAGFHTAKSASCTLRQENIITEYYVEELGRFCNLTTSNPILAPIRKCEGGCAGSFKHKPAFSSVLSQSQVEEMAKTQCEVAGNYGLNCCVATSSTLHYASYYRLNCRGTLYNLGVYLVSMPNSCTCMNCYLPRFTRTTSKVIHPERCSNSLVRSIRV